MPQRFLGLAASATGLLAFVACGGSESSGSTTSTTTATTSTTGTAAGGSVSGGSSTTSGPGGAGGGGYRKTGVAGAMAEDTIERLLAEVSKAAQKAGLQFSWPDYDLFPQVGLW